MKLVVWEIFNEYPADRRQMAHSAEAAEYTDCISAEGWVSSNECPAYDTKNSDGKAAIILELWGMQSTSSLPFDFRANTLGKGMNPLILPPAMGK